MRASVSDRDARECWYLFPSLLVISWTLLRFLDTLVHIFSCSYICTLHRDARRVAETYAQAVKPDFKLSPRGKSKVKFIDCVYSTI